MTIFIIIPINYIIMIHEKTLQYINKPTLVACQDSTCPVYFFWPKKEQSFLNSAISTMQFRVGKLHKCFEFSHLAPLFSAVVFPYSNDNKSENFNFFLSFFSSFYKTDLGCTTNLWAFGHRDDHDL